MTRRRADGRYQRSYTGADGRRHYVYAETRREVDRKLHEALRDKELGLYVAGPSQSVEQFLVAWLRSLRDQVRPTTLERYEQQVRGHAIPALGKIPLRKLQPQHVADLYAGLRDSLSPASIRHLHAVLHSALKQAVGWNLVARNPVTAVRAPRHERREMRMLSIAETRALLEAVRGDELEALYVLALTSGLRQGELLALRWRDVDLDRGWIDVNATLTRAGGSVRRSAPKTKAGLRAVKLTARGLAAMRAHRLRMAEQLLPLRARPEGDVFVFLEGGLPLNGSHLTERRWKPLLRAAGLREIRFHDLRHAFASLMLSQGVRVDLVSQMLGHSSPALTLSIYSHILPGDQESAVQRLDAVLGASA